VISASDVKATTIRPAPFDKATVVLLKKGAPILRAVFYNIYNPKKLGRNLRIIMDEFKA
jgi:hypothetical protein